MARIKGDLRERTFRFGEAILRIVDFLPNNNKGWIISRQVIRSGTSVGALVREADNALTDADFANKCNIARKEASETNYWLELCAAVKLLVGNEVQALIRESDELAKILASIVIGTHEYMEKRGN